MTFNVMATIRTEEITGYSEPDGEPIYEPQDSHRVYLEGFDTEADAQRAANSAVRSNPGVVVAAWIQPAGEFPDPTRARR